MIRLHDITIRVRDRFLFAGTCWEINAKENWAVIGPNGAGKTSLVSAIAGDVPVVGGRVALADELQIPGRIGFLSFDRHRQVIAREEARDEFRYFSGRFGDELTTRKLLAETGPQGEGTPRKMARIAEQLGIQVLLPRPVRSRCTP